MDNYILIHLLEGDEPVALGISHIASVQSLYGADSEGTEISLSQGSVFVAKESFKDLMSKIDSLYKEKMNCNCGCQD